MVVYPMEEPCEERGQKPEMGEGLVPEHETIAVVYGDPVVGQTLALLLGGAGYRVIQKPLTSLDDPAERRRLLENVRVLVLAPALESRRRDMLLEAVTREPLPSRVSVLELGTPPEGARNTADYSAPWPGQTENLRRRIEGILSGSREARKPHLNAARRENEVT
jgi:hypothetical protein